jgi:hypothetical protein
MDFKRLDLIMQFLRYIRYPVPSLMHACRTPNAPWFCDPVYLSVQNAILSKCRCHHAVPLNSQPLANLSP